LPKIMSLSVCIATRSFLILGVKREHHLGQNRCVGRESFGTNRHV